MNQLTETIRSGLQNLLGRHLPGRTKRLIFLASFSARLKNCTSLNKETVHRLNQLMVLATEESAIQLPVQLSKAIWKDSNLDMPGQVCLADTDLSKDTIQKITEQVLRQTPSWLRYGDEKQDVEKLLNNRSLVFGA